FILGKLICGHVQNPELSRQRIKIFNSLGGHNAHFTSVVHNTHSYTLLQVTIEVSSEEPDVEVILISSSMVRGYSWSMIKLESWLIRSNVMLPSSRSEERRVGKE